MGGFLCKFDDFKEKLENNYEMLHREEINRAETDDMLHKSVCVHGAFQCPLPSKSHTQKLYQRTATHTHHIKNAEYPQVFLPVPIYPEQHEKAHARS